MCDWDECSRGLGIVGGFSQKELGLVRLVLRNGGVTHELLTGTFENEEIVLDGKVLCEVTFISWT